MTEFVRNFKKAGYSLFSFEIGHPGGKVQLFDQAKNLEYCMLPVRYAMKFMLMFQKGSVGISVDLQVKERMLTMPVSEIPAFMTNALSWDQSQQGKDFIYRLNLAGLTVHFFVINVRVVKVDEWMTHNTAERYDLKLIDASGMRVVMSLLAEHKQKFIDLHHSDIRNYITHEFGLILPDNERPEHID